MATTGLPVQITRAPLRTVRPVMLRRLYANPEKELVRMRKRGRLVRIASGTYTAKPDTVATDTAWFPNFEEAAIAYATGQYGPRVPILFGIGAARFHHAIPRALGVTVIAVPEQHRPVTLTNGGRVVFTCTDTSMLDARLETGGLGKFMVTTPEQTFVDLLARPELGGLPAEAHAAAAALASRIDPDRARRIAALRPAAVQRRVQAVLQ
ncbi:type IV toxin-antitoxin system AbiEi family antitoxin [Raineyella sp.]|uniref:AbiEi antitoxin C-terminal domain-containing protein n=1 Tax=bioreactor metagenome TaxID=1076179 RepID=A0A645ETG1_9ZZZZ|nr:type IV toxin-antitoxin system AbiEi family antitoxin [Raineyella sp.]MEA5153610.1 type IV toxin-antitoxin system AbiEi family antitoxin [Raineyella sp.]